MPLFKFPKNAGVDDAADKAGDFFKNIFQRNKIEEKAVEAEKVGEKVILKGKVPTREAAEKMIVAAGNNKGVAEVESELEIEEADPAPEATMYEVQSGDSLSKIALAQYGDALKYPVIFEANQPMLADPDKIYPGQMLRIPAKTW